MQFQEFLLVWMANDVRRSDTNGTARSNQCSLERLPGWVQS